MVGSYKQRRCVLLRRIVAKCAYTPSAKHLIQRLLCVDPAQRYTIDEFLNDPWCKASAAPPPPPTPGVYGTTNAPLDSPLLMAMRGGREARSPGLASLKEAFDITYAVHRMEEEGARRRAQKGGANRGFLSGLNEEDEAAIEEEDIVEDARRRYGDKVSNELSKELEERRRRDPGRTTQAHQVQQVPVPAGVGAKVAAKRAVHKSSHPPSSTVYDGRAGQRDRGKRTGVPFDLDLEAATILGRRHKRGLDHPEGSPLKLAGTVTLENPASPMRVE